MNNKNRMKDPQTSLEHAARACNILAYGARLYPTDLPTSKLYYDVTRRYAEQTKYLLETHLAEEPPLPPPGVAELARLQNARKFLAGRVPCAEALPDIDSVSIVTPFYAHLRFFAECAQSVQDCFAARPDIDAEWVLLNDDPDIPDAELLRLLPGDLQPFVRLMGDGQNRGITARLNEGVLAAKGRWILFLDCDDRIDPNALPVLAKYIKRFPRCRYISSCMRDIDDEGALTRLRMRRELPVDLFGDYMTAGHLKAVRQDVFGDVGLFDAAYEGCQDFAFAIRASLHEPILYIPDFLYDYRWHGKSQSVGQARRQFATARRIVHEMAPAYTGGTVETPRETPPCGTVFPPLSREQVAAWRMGLLPFCPPAKSQTEERELRKSLYVWGIFLHAWQYPSLPITLTDEAVSRIRQTGTDGIPLWARVLSAHEALTEYGPFTVEKLPAFILQISLWTEIDPHCFSLLLGEDMRARLHAREPAVVPELAREGVPVFLQAIYSLREDLQHIFKLDKKGAEGLLAWWSSWGISEYPAVNTHISPNGSRPDASSSPADSPASCFTAARRAICAPAGLYLDEGVNIIGYASLTLGISEDVRMAAHAAEEAAIPYCLHEPPSLTHSDNRHPEWSLRATRYPLYKANIIFLPGVESYRLRLVSGDGLLNERYTICAWQWELPEWPKQLLPCLDIAHEVWASTEFTAASIRGKSSVPVRVMPMAVDVQPFAALPRSAFGLPEDVYCFLFVYDGFSRPERKNPAGAIMAFQTAFPRRNDVRLVIKSMNVGMKTAPQGKLLQEAALRDPRIVLITETLPQDQLYALYNTCDAYVSLHRAEGFGRTMAEAMLLEKPVIASNFSGNTDFCTTETSFLVGGNMVPLAEKDYFFGDGQHWFDPSPEEAAMWMRQCVDNPCLAASVAKAGRALLLKKYSPKAVGECYRARLLELGILAG